MSVKTTKQSFLNFIFKETVEPGNFWSRGWEGRRHPGYSSRWGSPSGGRRRGLRVPEQLSLEEMDIEKLYNEEDSVVFSTDNLHLHEYSYRWILPNSLCSDFCWEELSFFTCSFRNDFDLQWIFICTAQQTHTNHSASKTACVLAGSWLSQKKKNTKTNVFCRLWKYNKNNYKYCLPFRPHGGLPYPMILFWGVEVGRSSCHKCFELLTHVLLWPGWARKETEIFLVKELGRGPSYYLF